MKAVKNGDTILVHYKGSLEDGTVFDSSLDSEPMKFTIGGGEIIPGFESAVLGMNVGDKKTVKIPSDQAYGSHHTEMVQTIPRDAFPENVKPTIGQQFQVSPADGECEDFIVRVTDVNEENVVLDANHPLAGKDLIFDIDLVAIC
jgi:peptidylprolyl isomerase